MEPTMLMLDTKNDEAIPQTLGDLQPMEYAQGCAAGAALAVDVAHAARINGRLGFDSAETIRSALAEAFDVLSSTPALQGPDRRGAAAGLVDSLCRLAFRSIQTGEGIKLLEDLAAQAQAEIQINRPEIK